MEMEAACGKKKHQNFLMTSERYTGTKTLK